MYLKALGSNGDWLHKMGEYEERVLCLNTKGKICARNLSLFFIDELFYR